MHHCFYIAATEGRADFSPWGTPHTHSISIECIHSIPWRSKSCCLHQIWELRSPQAVDLGHFCSPSPEFPWQIKGLCAQPAESNSQQSISFNLPRWVEKTWKLENLFLQETEIKEGEKNKEAQLSLKRHSIPRKGEKQNVIALCKKVSLNMQLAPFGSQWGVHKFLL